jgi:hypothetical protein
VAGGAIPPHPATAIYRGGCPVSDQPPVASSDIVASPLSPTFRPRGQVSALGDQARTVPRIFRQDCSQSVVAGPRTLHWRNLVALTTVCTVNGKVVIEVDALVIPTSREPCSTNRL